MKEVAATVVKAPAKKEAAPAKTEAKKPAAKKGGEGKKIKVTLIRSTIGALKKQKLTVEALGLRKIRSSRIHNDNDAIRGMLFVVRHMVKVEEI